MNYYILTIIGFMCAQFFMASLQVYDYQKSKDITWWNAMKVYSSAEFGWFVIAFFGLLLVLFILPDLINIDIKQSDLFDKDLLTWKEKAQKYFRITIVCLGAFIQYLGFKLRKTGKQAIDKAIDGVG